MSRAEAHLGVSPAAPSQDEPALTLEQVKKKTKKNFGTAEKKTKKNFGRGEKNKKNLEQVKKLKKTLEQVKKKTKKNSRTCEKKLKNTLDLVKKTWNRCDTDNLAEEGPRHL